MMNEMIVLSMNVGIDFEVIEMNLMIDVGFIVMDRMWNSFKKVEVIFEVIVVKINGNFILRLILKIVGFVILSNVEILVEEVRVFCFWFLVVKKIVKVVVFCLMLAIEVIGKIKEFFVLVMLVNNWVLIVGKVWWSLVMIMVE